MALALGAFADASLGLAAVLGGAVAIVSVLAWLRYPDRLLDASATQVESLYPSPARVREGSRG